MRFLSIVLNIFFTALGYILYIPFKILSFCYHWRECFCKHDFKEEILSASYGLFGGAKRRICKRCGYQDDGESWGRLKKLNDSYK